MSRADRKTGTPSSVPCVSGILYDLARSSTRGGALTSEIQAVSGALTDIGAALQNLPEPVRRNLFHAVGTLITGLVDVPASWLDMKANEFKVRKAGHEQIMLAAARNAAGLANHSPELGDRALAYFANDLARAQANREAVAREAIEAADSLSSVSCNAGPVSETPAIDEDWLEQFRKLAASKSNSDIQAILGRVLAGEAQKPGTFSPMTLDIISKLDHYTAKNFEGIASCAIVIPNRTDLVISSIIGADMIKLDYLLDEMVLRHLQSFGLVGSSTGYGVNLDYFKTLPESTLGGEVAVFSACPGFEVGAANFVPPLHTNVWPLSQTGEQLLPLLSKSFHRSYARRLRDGMKRLGVALTFPSIDVDADFPTGAPEIAPPK